MDKLNYTKGPWKVCPKLKHYAHPEKIVWGPRGEGFGSVCETDHPDNAKLIAMAPELYEACTEFVTNFRVSHTDWKLFVELITIMNK